MVAGIFRGPRRREKGPVFFRHALEDSDRSVRPAVMAILRNNDSPRANFASSKYKSRHGELEASGGFGSRRTGAAHVRVLARGRGQSTTGRAEVVSGVRG